MPAFARAWRLDRELRVQKAAPGAAAAAHATAIEAELAAIGVEMADCFPLDDAQYRSLRLGLQEHVLGLHKDESRLLKELRQLSRATTGR